MFNTCTAIEFRIKNKVSHIRSIYTIIKISIRYLNILVFCKLDFSLSLVICMFNKLFNFFV